MVEPALLSITTVCSPAPRPARSNRRPYSILAAYWSTSTLTVGASDPSGGSMLSVAVPPSGPAVYSQLRVSPMKA